ncbi:uncharacterized protein LOC127866577 isoform X2 [Dreissena polymorpha]|uniref:uncharacterized protein LOC127866577 isoform X2 n=1 Tax=Dreissena polymorpha TaxID=45954 RepID=UPI002264DFD0|nr:uncharacterized protein LOC127866577 isoform X2 [Dreissena polymorpha]
MAEDVCRWSSLAPGVPLLVGDEAMSDVEMPDMEFEQAEETLCCCHGRRRVDVVAKSHRTVPRLPLVAMVRRMEVKSGKPGRGRAQLRREQMSSLVGSQRSASLSEAQQRKVQVPLSDTGRSNVNNKWLCEDFPPLLDASGLREGGAHSFGSHHSIGRDEMPLAFSQDFDVAAGSQASSMSSFDIHPDTGVRPKVLKKQFDFVKANQSLLEEYPLAKKTKRVGSLTRQNIEKFLQDSDNSSVSSAIAYAYTPDDAPMYEKYAVTLEDIRKARGKSHGEWNEHMLYDRLQSSNCLEYNQPDHSYQNESAKPSDVPYFKNITYSQSTNHIIHLGQAMDQNINSPASLSNKKPHNALDLKRTSNIAHSDGYIERINCQGTTMEFFHDDVELPSNGSQFSNVSNVTNNSDISLEECPDWEALEDDIYMSDSPDEAVEVSEPHLASSETEQEEALFGNASSVIDENQVEKINDPFVDDFQEVYPTILLQNGENAHGIKEVTNVAETQDTIGNSSSADTTDLSDINSEVEQIAKRLNMKDDKSNIAKICSAITMASSLPAINTSKLRGSAVAVEGEDVHSSDMEGFERVVNHKKKAHKKQKSTPIKKAPVAKENSIWRLYGRDVVQVDGLPSDVDLTHLHSLVNGFGVIKDSQVRTLNSMISVRYKLVNEEACEFCAQCLHNSECIVPGSNTTGSNCVISCQHLDV